MNQQWTLGRRLGLGFGVIIVVAVAAVLPSRWSLSSVASSFNELGALAAHQETVHDVREALTTQRALQAEYAVEHNDELLTTFEETAEVAFSGVDEIVAAFPESQTVTDVAARVEQLDVQHDTIVLDQMVPAFQAGDDEAGLAYLAEATSVLNELLTDVGELENVVDAEIETLAGGVSGAVSSATRNITIALLLLVLVGGAVAFVTSRRIGSVVGALVERMVASVRNLQRLNDGMGVQAADTSEQASVAVESVNAVSGNVARVASSTEQLGAAVNEIAQNASEANRVAGDAVGQAGQARETIAKLGESSAEIGKVIEVITSIAEQTNLLALNATIEAARAGEAGKGFAVVANEVKELAQETASSSQEIRHRISAIQAESQGAVDAIHKVSEIVDQIAALQTTIASAVEQQSVTTDEIARSAAEAANASESISSSVVTVAGSASEATEAVDEVRRAEIALGGIADELRHLIGVDAGARQVDAGFARTTDKAVPAT